MTALSGGPRRLGGFVGRNARHHRHCHLGRRTKSVAANGFRLLRFENGVRRRVMATAFGWRWKSQSTDIHQQAKGASMNATKTSKGMQTVKVLSAVLATLFAVLAAGCATQAPTPGLTQAPQIPAE
jgi:hypothetical protein